MEIGEAILEDHEDHDMTEPQETLKTLHKKDSHKRKPTWEQDLLQEEERCDTLEGMHIERKRPKHYNIYVSLLCDIIEEEPFTYEEDA